MKIQWRVTATVIFEDAGGKTGKEQAILLTQRAATALGNEKAKVDDYPGWTASHATPEEIFGLEREPSTEI